MNKFAYMKMMGLRKVAANEHLKAQLAQQQAANREAQERAKVEAGRQYDATMLAAEQRNTQLKAQLEAAKKAEAKRKAAERKQIQTQYDKTMADYKQRQHQAFLERIAANAKKEEQTKEKARQAAIAKDRAAQVKAIEAGKQERQELLERLRMAKMTPAQRMQYNTAMAAASRAIPADSSYTVKKDPSYAMQLISQKLPKSPAERTRGLAGYNEEQQIAQDKADLRARRKEAEEIYKRTATESAPKEESGVPLNVAPQRAVSETQREAEADADYVNYLQEEARQRRAQKAMADFQKNGEPINNNAVMGMTAEQKRLKDLAQRQAAVPTEKAKAWVNKQMAADQKRQQEEAYQKAINGPVQYTQFGKDFVNKQIRQMNPVNYMADLLQGPTARLNQQVQIAQGNPSLSLLSRLARGGTMRPGEAGAHISNLARARAYENSGFWNKLWNWIKQNWYKLTGNTYGANTTQKALARKARNAADAISASMQ